MQGIKGEVDCCSAAEPTSLLDEIRAKRARVAADMRRRIRDLDQAEKLLLNSDAEAIIRDARKTLREN